MKKKCIYLFFFIMFVSSIMIVINKKELFIEKDIICIKIKNPSYPEEINGVRTCMNNKEIKKYKYMMNDERWGDKKLGNSNAKIKDKGDLLCCLAMATTRTEWYSDAITPVEINERLEEINAFMSDGEIIEDKLLEVFEDFQSHNDFEKISQEDCYFLRNPGKNDVVYDVVKVKKNGEFRWVFIAGLANKGKEYLVLDPQEEKATNMTTYGNYIYSWYTLGALKPKESYDYVKLKKPSANAFLTYPQIKKRDKMHTFDAAWASKKMGNSKNTIASEGDLLCCLATVTSVLNDVQTTPEEINFIFSIKNVYEVNGEINVSKLEDVLEYFDNHVIMNEELYNHLPSLGETLEIVKVKKEDRERWVVIEGITEDENDYKIFDPQEKLSKCLEDYGSTIYGWYTVGDVKN